MTSFAEWADRVLAPPAPCPFCGSARVRADPPGWALARLACAACGEVWAVGLEPVNAAACRERLFRRVWALGVGLYGLWANAADEEIRRVATLRLRGYARRHGLAYARITGSRDDAGAVDYGEVIEALAPVRLLAPPANVQNVQNVQSVQGPSVFDET